MRSSQEAIRVLSQACNPGQTTIVLTQDPAHSAIRAGSLLVIDPYTVEAELRRVKTIAGTTVTLDRPLAYGHSGDDRVWAITPGAIPWDWWGARPISAPFAGDNVLGFNRLAQEIYKYLPGGRIEIPPGTWYVNGELKPDRDQGIRGHGPTTSAIVATADFPFDTTGQVAMIHPQRDGNPVGYDGTFTTRCFIDGLYVNGANVPNANGVLFKVQQPMATRDLRIDNCLGLYGLCVMGQDGHFGNLEMIGCAVPLRIRGGSLMLFDDLNIEQTKGAAHVVLENAANDPVAVWNTFRQVHFEKDQETIGFDVRGGASAFRCEDLYYANPVTGTCFRFDTPQANPGGACRYVLDNIWCNQNSNTYWIVDDIQRGKRLNSFSDTDRWIDHLTPRIMAAGYVKTP